MSVRTWSSQPTPSSCPSGRESSWSQRQVVTRARDRIRQSSSSSGRPSGNAPATCPGACARSNSTGPVQQVSRSMNRGPPAVSSTLPGWGSPWSTCWGPRRLTSSPRLCRVSRRNARSASGRRGVRAGSSTRASASSTRSPTGRTSTSAARIAACRRVRALCVLARRQGTILARCVVGPQGDLEVIAHVHLRGSARIEAADGRPCRRQTQHPIHLDLRPGVVSGSDAGDEIAGQHPHGEAIGVLEVDDLVGLESEGSHHLHGGETGAGCRVRMHPADARAADARAQSFPRSRSRSRSRSAARSRCWCGC